MHNVTNAAEFIISPECKIFFRNKETCISNISTKELYWLLTDEIAQRPTSEDTWNKKSELALTESEWKTIYTGPYKVNRDTALITLHYKITHRTLACGYNLQKWQIKDTSQCEKCFKEDTIEHYLVECEHTTIFWKQLYKWWHSITGVCFPVNTYETIFLYPNDDNDMLFAHLNFILLHALYYVYSTKKNNKMPHLYEALLIVEKKLYYEKEIALRNDKIEVFEKKWGLLIDSV
jgi:hypothetical protein